MTNSITEAPSWTLANVEERAYAFATFKIPSRVDREDLQVGDVAKLVFLNAAGGDGERMWVKVERFEGLRYRGILRNHPVVIHELHFGDEIEFAPEHIADWAAGQ